MKDILKLLKEGNKPSLLAAIVNTVIAMFKSHRILLHRKCCDVCRNDALIW